MQSKSTLLTVFVFYIIFSLPFLHMMGNKEVWWHAEKDVENRDAILDNTYEFMQLRQELWYFDDDVKSHMHDVRALYWYSIIIFFTVLSLTAVLVFFMKRREVYDSIINACKGIIALWMVFAAWTIISFNSFFDFFHRMLFSGNYSFSLDNPVLQLFPQTFFQNLGIIIGLTEIGFALLIISLLKD